MGRQDFLKKSPRCSDPAQMLPDPLQPRLKWMTADQRQKAGGTSEAGREGRKEGVPEWQVLGHCHCSRRLIHPLQQHLTKLAWSSINKMATPQCKSSVDVINDEALDAPEICHYIAHCKNGNTWVACHTQIEDNAAFIMSAAALSLCTGSGQQIYTEHLHVQRGNLMRK